MLVQWFRKKSHTNDGGFGILKVWSELKNGEEKVPQNSIKSYLLWSSLVALIHVDV